MNISPHELFYKATELRNITKQILQLSWSIAQFERKFPFRDDLNDTEMVNIIAIYDSFLDELTKISQSYQTLKKDELIIKMKNNGPKKDV